MVPALLKYESNKYKILYEKSEWCAPSEEEKHILALNTRITWLKKTGRKNQNFVIVLFLEEERQARKHQGVLPPPQGAG